MYRQFGKRLFDFVTAVLTLIVLSPLLCLIAFAVRFKLGSPVLFRQYRPGHKGVPFILLKFRTMNDSRDSAGNLNSDAERLTRFGRFLRSTSLDELPELLNVARGEMSLVGPRPLLMRYYPYFKRNEQARFSVRPGITGLAQVSGRNDLSWTSRFAFDVQYVREYTLWLDLRILLLTVWRSVNRDGLRVDPGATMVDLDEERRHLRPKPPE